MLFAPLETYNKIRCWNITNKKAIIVAISGGSGSGKTTIAHQLRDHLQHSVKSVILYQDNYYKDQKDIPLPRRATVNYDQPQAFDWVLMKRDLENLKNLKAVDTPLYDFTHHTRSAETHHIDPVDVVIFEGFMSLHQNVVAYSDIRLFVDTPSDERLLRRMIRDINERGRTFDSVASQWRSTVRPMYRAHVAPQKESAHIIIPWYEISPVAIKAIKGSILDFVNAPADRPAPAIPNVNPTIEKSAHAGEEPLTALTGAIPPIAANGTIHPRTGPQLQRGPRQQQHGPQPGQTAGGQRNQPSAPPHGQTAKAQPNQPRHSAQQRNNSRTPAPSAAVLKSDSPHQGAKNQQRQPARPAAANQGQQRHQLPRQTRANQPHAGNNRHAQPSRPSQAPFGKPKEPVKDGTDGF